MVKSIGMTALDWGGQTEITFRSWAIFPIPGFDALGFAFIDPAIYMCHISVASSALVAICIEDGGGQALIAPPMQGTSSNGTAQGTRCFMLALCMGICRAGGGGTPEQVGALQN